MALTFTIQTFYEYLQPEWKENRLVKLVKHDKAVHGSPHQNNRALRDWLIAYSHGAHHIPSFECYPEGTEFEQRVWQYLTTIPYGKKVSYKDVAVGIHSPKSSRAVGNACRKNPIPLIIPCHRIIGSNGKLTGFAWGLDIKDMLLKHEEHYK